MSAPEVVALFDEGLGNSSYLVDLGNGDALVIDPTRDPRAYLAEANRRALRVAMAAETHLHADFVSGARALAASGATVIAARAAGLEYPHKGLADGDDLDLGGLSLQALATPGHTPEHLAYVLRENERPLALFSGGSLLVGAVARTDLISPDQTEALARHLYRSITEKLLALPDDLIVYPTHGAGSFCSTPGSTERWTTVGAERATNPLLAAPDESAFVTILLETFGSYPPYFRTLRERNRSGPIVYGDAPPTLALLGVDEVRRLVSDGAELVDVRPFRSFGNGHIPGCLSNPLRPQFASWLGWLVEPGRPVVFVLDPEQDRAELVRQCLQIGYENLPGELTGGVDAWAATGRPLDRINVIGTKEVDAAHVLDVRQDSESQHGHIPGSAHVELGTLADRIDAAPAGPVTLMCGHGERAMSAASLLARTGRRDISVLAGGPEDWAEQTGHALATGG